MTSTHHRRRRWTAGLGAMLALGAVPAVASAAPSDTGCDNRNLRTIDQFLSCVDADDAFEHLEAFQSFADASGGTRASGTPGYDASASYVADTLAAVGFSIERQVFDFSLFTELSSSLTVDGADVPTQTFEYSGSGTVADGNVVPVDLDLGLGNTSTSGCETEDFDDLEAAGAFDGDSDIALLQRGACNFSVKAVNAQDAGAEAVIIFNQGNADGRFGIIGGTLGEGVVGVLTIPVLDVSYDDGVAIRDAADVDLSAETEIDTRTTENVIADLPGENPDNVVMAGAHLDSVTEGPGIQDNGSGSAALLAIAEQLGANEKYTPQNTLRFAWWGAEESGLIGSNNYVFSPDFGLTQEEYEAIALYINFDMIASPNYIYGVYDADESSFEAPVPVPPGSAALEDLFEAYYSDNGIPYEDTEFSGRSDYQAFISVGIPSSGLFTGAEVVKTPEQQSIWGGVAGEQFDQCYHLACDTIDNVSFEALDVNIDAVAYAVFNLAASTELVNGVAGATIPGPGPADVAIDGPQGTFLDGGGGLDHTHDHGPGITS
jgi:Zn-dependent M28 family amino/carboxypeptidase